MAECFLVQSGGMPLNFKVVCNPQPSTAKENTIWVDTDKINNYYFSAEQPENMAEYDVWFLIGTSSTVAFNATKKNPIMVYPRSAKQYVGGAWVNKTAKIYQGGVWADFSFWIIRDGKLNTSVVTALNLEYSEGSSGYIRFKNGYIQVETPNGSYNRYTSDGYIPTSQFTKLYLDYESYNGADGNGEQFALNNKTCLLENGDFARSVVCVDISAVDIDCTFSLIARAWVTGNDTTNKYYNLWLE